MADVQTQGTGRVRLPRKFLGEVLLGVPGHRGAVVGQSQACGRTAPSSSQGHLLPLLPECLSQISLRLSLLRTPALGFRAPTDNPG